jgi:hypothetical protein
MDVSQLLASFHMCGAAAAVNLNLYIDWQHNIWITGFTLILYSIQLFLYGN